MLAHTTEQIALAPDARLFENTNAITLTDSKWSTIRQIRSQGVYTDAVKGNVIEHVAAENADGKIVYIGTRLKVVEGKVSEVEINFDDRANINAKKHHPVRSGIQYHRAAGSTRNARATGARHHLLFPRTDRSPTDRSRL